MRLFTCSVPGSEVIDYGSVTSRPAGSVECSTWVDVLGYPEPGEPWPTRESLFNHHWHWVCLDLGVDTLE